MAVETRFVVVKNGVDMDIFTDKKVADQYDRMLDMAEALSTLISGGPIDLNEADQENLAIFLAKNRDELLYALQAKKKPATPSNTAKPKAKTKNNDEGLK